MQKITVNTKEKYDMEEVSKEMGNQGLLLRIYNCIDYRDPQYMKEAEYYGTHAFWVPLSLFFFYVLCYLWVTSQTKSISIEK